MSEEPFVSVGQVAHRDLHMVSGVASVQEAIAEMQRIGVSSLVIERRHPGDEYGMVTIRDIAAKVISQNRSTERVSVYEIMTKPPVTLNAGMNVKYATRLLSRLDVSRALVTQDDEVLGMVTLRDLLLAYAGQ